MGSLCCAGCHACILYCIAGVGLLDLCNTWLAYDRGALCVRGKYRLSLTNETEKENPIFPLYPKSLYLTCNINIIFPRRARVTSPYITSSLEWIPFNLSYTLYVFVHVLGHVDICAHWIAICFILCEDTGPFI